jgi:hypothetical protein
MRKLGQAELNFIHKVCQGLVICIITIPGFGKKPVLKLAQ